MANMGITSISFFGATGSSQSYVDDSGRFRYERGVDGAEFVYSIQLSEDRAITLRVVAFDKSRSLDELEKDASEQVRRMLLYLGKLGEQMPDRIPATSESGD